jgi:hypothetical protein
MAKKHDFQEQKTRQRQKTTFFKQKISKTMDKMISWGMPAPFLMMPVTLQGITNTWAGKKLFFKLLAAQAALAPSRSAMFIVESPISYQALILIFLVIKCFLKTSVVFWRDKFYKNFVL